MTAKPAPAAGPARLGFREIYALVFGLFLGLALLKFGNPVILDHQVLPPKGLAEAIDVSWPVLWGNLSLLVLTLAALPLAFGGPRPAARPATLADLAPWVLPLLWLGWQFGAAAHSVDAALTTVTLTHLTACVGCFLIGRFALGKVGNPRLLLLGLLAALALCVVRGVNQHTVEFKHDRQALVEGQSSGWTNFPAEALTEMKRNGLVLHTNGVDIANPVILLKLERGRINGTLVYPNAFAGVLLLLLPAALALAVFGTLEMKRPIRALLLTLVAGLGFGCLYWTGSKSGWLIALGLGAGCLFRLKWSRRWKTIALVGLMVLGLAAFAVKFRTYFAAGATSVSARFDYWRAAAQTTAENPWFGTGPGTFQRPYARLKAPEAEMARLVHNDYLEQFSDSGLVGGVTYLAWIGLLFTVLARKYATEKDPLWFALFLGLAGWFVQGFVEFGLYIPALAWTAFTLAGVLVAAPVPEAARRPR
ncbi:MAG TPA: O-antigen ligase family protein [Candidatus Limnocylindria bacterium]|nr:O-antigen ligase family protein [Candidatus Limnocylindria bacterium]